MQFVCNNCKAKYEIPADRIKGRIMKIRCRECGNIFEVRGDAILSGKGGTAGSGEGRPSSPQSTFLKDRFKASFTSKKPLRLSSAVKPKTAPAPPTKADKLLKLARKAESRALEMKESDKWYVAIKSSPVGPVNKSKIRAYIRRGDLTQASLVWREGYNDWKPLRTAPELKNIFDEVQGELQQPDKIDIAARLRRAAGEGAGSAAPAPAARPTPAPPRAPRAVGAALKPAEPVPVEKIDSQPARSAPRPAVQEQSESVIDDALRGYYVGRIDGGGSLPGMESMRPSYAAEYMPQDYLGLGERGGLGKRLMQSRLFLFLGGAIALLAGFGIMVVVMTSFGEEEQPALETTVPKEQPSEPQEEEEEVEEGDLLAGLIISVEEVLESEEALIEEQEENERDPRAKKSSKGSKSAKDKVFKTSVMDMPDIEEHSISDSDLKKKVSGKSSSGGQRGKNGLTDDQIKSTVLKKSKTIQRCYEKVLGKGMGVNEKIKVKVQVRVGTSGKVTRVKVINVSKYGNFLTPCIENGIKTWTFPRADATSEFIFPVLLTPKS